MSETVNEPKTGELWIHKRNGDIFLIKELYTLAPKRLQDLAYSQHELTIVKAIRLRDQYEWDEPLGMFTWEYTRLN